MYKSTIMTELETLKLIMKDNNLSQKDLALILDVSKQFINALLNEKSNKKISKKLLLKIQEKYPSYFSPIRKLDIPDFIDYKYLEYFRKHYNYSKVEIAKYLRISQSYYSLLSSNKKDITDTIIKRLHLLNDNPNKEIDSSLVEKSSPIEIDYYASIEDYNSKHGRKLVIDRLLLSNRNISESCIVCLKINCSGKSYNVLFDTSSKNKRTKCTSILNKDTFYSEMNMKYIGEIIGLIIL